MTYETALAQIKPLDVLLFRGGDFVSTAIRRIEARRVRNGGFSHAALVITGATIDFTSVHGPKAQTIDPDKLYVWEITMSGKLNDGVTDIFGRSFLGVQVRPLDAVIAAARKNTRVKVAWLRLKRSPFADISAAPSEYAGIPRPFGSESQLRQILTTLYHETLEAPYEACLCILIAATFPRLRCCSTQGTKRFFCSEFVAYVLKRVGVLASSTKEQNVIPVDFIPGVDEDHEVDCCEAPVYLV